MALDKKHRRRRRADPKPDPEAVARVDEARNNQPEETAPPERVTFRQQLRKEMFAMRHWRCPVGHGGKTADTRPTCPICDKKMVEVEE